MLDRCFIIGSDNESEWMINWFVDNYSKHNDIPLVFVDFGVSNNMLADLTIDKRIFEIVSMTNESSSVLQKWFLKPSAIINTNAKQKVWIDIDCEILENLDTIFDQLETNKLSMVIDYPWTKSRNEIWHNSGVVGVINNPDILFQWCYSCKTDPANKNPIALYGDQDVLHKLMKDPLTRIRYIKDLSNEYNYTRIQMLDNDKMFKKIIHWTGRLGKQIIRKKIKNDCHRTHNR